MRILLTIILLLALGCKCPEKAAGQANAGAQLDSGLTRIMAEAYGGGEEEAMHLINSRGELQKFFNSVNKTRKPGLPVPEIDFERNQVVVYSAGMQQGEGLPELVRLESKDGQIVLGVVAAKEVSGNSATAVTTPFIVYSMPRTEKKVVLGTEKGH